MIDFQARDDAADAVLNANRLTALRQAAARYRSKLNGGTGRIIVAECSIGYGQGATNGNGYIQQLQSDFAAYGQWSSYAWPSHPMSSYLWAPRTSGVDIGATMSAVTPLISDLFIGGNPTNDIFGLSAYNTDGASYQGASDLTQMQRRMMAVASYFCVPETNRVRTITPAGAFNPAVVRTGSWNAGYTAFSATDPGVGWCNAVNSTAAYTTTPGNFIILRTNTAQSATATFDVSIDGVSQGTFYSKGTYDFWGADCFMFPVPMAASHSVVIKQLTGDAVFIRGVDCFDINSDYSATFMYMLPCDQSPLGWSAGQSNRGGANSAIAAGYSTVASGASVSGNTLTISTTPETGRICEGQALSSAAGVGALPPGCRITQRISTNPTGVNSGAGVWRIDPPATANGALTNLVATFPGAVSVLENAALSRFRAGFDEAMQALSSLGMNIVKVPAHIGYNPDTMQNSNQAYLHPNDDGHRHLYRGWRPYMKAMFGLQ